jgi:hypothetical protein
MPKVLTVRTTIQIDDHLFRLLKEKAAHTGRTIGALVEDAVRESLAGAGPGLTRARWPGRSGLGGVRAGRYPSPDLHRTLPAGGGLWSLPAPPKATPSPLPTWRHRRSRTGRRSAQVTGVLAGSPACGPITLVDLFADGHDRLRALSSAPLAKPITDGGLAGDGGGRP